MSTYSDVDICNIALHSIGSEAIESLGDDKKAARACKSFYGFVRDYLLTAFDWNFAREYRVLEEAPGEYEDQFQVGTQPFINLSTNIYTFTNAELNNVGAIYECIGTYDDTTPDIVWSQQDFTVTPDASDITTVTLVIDPIVVIAAAPPDNVVLKARNLIDPLTYIPTGMYRYMLPENCEIVRSVGPANNRRRWQIVGDKIWAEQPDQIEIFYTKDEYNTFVFSTAFTNLLALGIAVRLAPIMAQDDTLAAKLYEQFTIDKAEAFAIDANEGNDYRALDENPENDTFVNPDLARSSFLQNTPQTNT